MDENSLLEECVNIKLTPLQTLLLSKTVIVISTLIDYLDTNGMVHIEKVGKNNNLLPDSEQVGNILLKSALVSMNEISSKIWENGKEQFGEEIPEEFEGIIGVYTIFLKEVANEVLNMLFMKGKE